MPPRSKKAVQVSDTAARFKVTIALEDLGHESAYAPEVAPREWMLPNRFKFSTWMQQTFQPRHYRTPAALFSHQRFIKDFMQYGSPYRGVLLYYGLGTGKSCASIASSEVLSMHDMDVVVLLPKSLRENFVSELKTCGNKLYRPQQEWIFHPAETVTNLEPVCQAMRLDPRVVKSAGGVWIPKAVRVTKTRKEVGQGIHYVNMRGDQRAALERQILDMIQHRYELISYNGLTQTLLDKLTHSDTQNPFDRKVVIIDEVHNFISRVMGGTAGYGKKLYNLLMQARDMKLICLSGTPMINYPHELSYLLNLVYGKMRVFYVAYTKGSVFDEVEIEAFLKTHSYIDHFIIRDDAQQIEIGLVPEGFVLTDRAAGLVRRTQAGELSSHEAIMVDLLNALTRRGVQVNKATNALKPSEQLLLPLEEDAFNEAFIDYGRLEIRNPYMLSRRIQGTLSYFEVYSADLYPKVHPLERVESPLTAHQFLTYTKIRAQERGRERKGRGGGGSALANPFQNKSGVYRTFSRAVSLFAFPAAIKRPYPSKGTFGVKEVDDIDGESARVLAAAKAPVATSKSVKQSEYQRNVSEAMRQLEEMRETYLTLDGELRYYSPKMMQMLQRIQASPGTCLVYSQYRSVEGIGVFALVLRANGFAELGIKKRGDSGWEIDMDPADYTKPKFVVFDSQDPDKTGVLMNIFNSNWAALSQGLVKQLEALHSATQPSKAAVDNLYGSVCKVMMITQSGSEGISLKHVRQVHIMEPYWNNIRIDQVIGRAVRARSHIGLPPEDRTVHVYMYVSKLTDEQIAEDYNIRTYDRAQTSDEYILNIAQRKTRIVTQLLKVMRSSAVDCNLHSSQHTHVQCTLHPFRRGDTRANPLMFTPNIKMDETDPQMEQHVQKVLVKGVPRVFRHRSGKFYILNDTTFQVYDYELYKASGKLMLVGHVEQLKTGKKRLRLLS